NYMRFTGRDEPLVQLVEAYAKAQGLFRADGMPDPVFSDRLELDLGEVESAIAGPKRPQDRINLRDAKQDFAANLKSMVREENLDGKVHVHGYDLKQGAVVIGAITSCTNTSNPEVMLGAGLLARKAVEKGLRTPPWVKTSLAPGSQVVTEYLDAAGVTPYLNQLGFDLVGYGCTTCLGNSGPLDEEITAAIKDGDLVAAAVLSGNRNFEGRINPDTRANYLASPPLVVAYSLAGRMDWDPYTEPIGEGTDGPVFLKDIWPSQAEVQEAVRSSVRSDMFRSKYAEVSKGGPEWQALETPDGDVFKWDSWSTYIKNPPYFEGMTAMPAPVTDIANARVLAMLGDSITTDHISPAGNISATSPAGIYLREAGIAKENFNSYGSRRGHDEVMVRGTFANIRLKNMLAPGTEGGVSVHLPGGESGSIFDVALRYKEEGVPVIVLAGKEYGSGSSRDWAAKGAYLQGIRAVIAESYERIHRSNLVGMGVLPLQYLAGESRESLGLTGFERYAISGIAADLITGKRLVVTATADDLTTTSFSVVCRIDTPVELDYYRHGGILQYVLRQLVAGSK
ncbi:MAG: aconitate hydratase AcnA, partial [Anaerolineaceae bacterium]